MCIDHTGEQLQKMTTNAENVKTEPMYWSKFKSNVVYKFALIFDYLL